MLGGRRRLVIVGLLIVVAAADDDIDFTVDNPNPYAIELTSMTAGDVSSSDEGEWRRSTSRSSSTAPGPADELQTWGPSWVAGHGT